MFLLLLKYILNFSLNYFLAYFQKNVNIYDVLYLNNI